MKQHLKNLGWLIVFAISAALAFTLFEAVIISKTENVVIMTNILTEAALFLMMIAVYSYILSVVLVRVATSFIAQTLFIIALILCLEVMDIGFILEFPNDRQSWVSRIIIIAAAAFAYLLARRDIIRGSAQNILPTGHLPQTPNAD